MAAVNEAWHVLRDPARRARYDASLRDTAPPPSYAPRPPVGDPDLDDDDPAADGEELARVARWGFPLSWIVVLVVLAVMFVFTAYAASHRSSGRDGVTTAAAVDGTLEVGSCAALDRVNQQIVAIEVACTAPHLGVVVSLDPGGRRCPAETFAYPDRTGRQLVCVKAA